MDILKLHCIFLQYRFLWVLEQPYLAVTVLFYQQFSTIFQTLRKMIKFVFKQILL